MLPEKRKIAILTVLLTCISFPVVYGQIDSSNLGWKIGLNAGYFVPSRHSAGFYSGHDYNENTINFILKNKYQFQEIMGLLDATDTFRLEGLPERMKYTPTLMVGFLFRNNVTENQAWFIQFNQVKLRASDFYTIEVDPKPLIGIFPDLRSYAIIGEENRYHIDLGYSHEFRLSTEMYRPFIDIGFTLTNTRVKSHKIRIEEREYSLVNVYGSNSYVPNTDLQTFQVIQGGVGYGGFLNLGLKLFVNNYFSLDPVIHFYLNTVNLDGYNHIRPHMYFNVRLAVNNLFLFNQTQLGGDEL